MAKKKKTEPKKKAAAKKKPAKKKKPAAKKRPVEKKKVTTRKAAPKKPKDPEEKVPLDDVKFLIDMILGKGQFDLAKSMRSLGSVVNYLMGGLFGEDSNWLTFRVQNTRKVDFDDHRLIQALAVLVEPHNDAEVEMAGILDLMPVSTEVLLEWLFELALKWIRGQNI